ncbi:unnamed protein product [Adineta steineri]|uniref:Uncharacterized protein n=1 Tax=Adineta steineri TaxID=433720 RepID=A0A819V5G4_9BILA|nr:unnamed protein product [Adineta steineri]
MPMCMWKSLMTSNHRNMEQGGDGDDDGGDVQAACGEHFLADNNRWHIVVHGVYNFPFEQLQSHNELLF